MSEQRTEIAARNKIINDLRTENGRLREALREIADAPISADLATIARQARAALGDTPND